MSDSAHARTPNVPEWCARLKALRKGLGLTQEEVAERSGGTLDRLAMVRLETGRNQATKLSTREALGRGLGITLEEINALIADTVTVDALVRRVRNRQTRAARAANETVPPSAA